MHLDMRVSAGGMRPNALTCVETHRITRDTGRRSTGLRNVQT